GASRLALRPVAVATVAATYALVVLGSTVRVTNSGMGCRSWPLCNGRIGPIDHLHPLLEQAHRYLAGAVSVGVVVLVLLAWQAGNSPRVLTRGLVAMALVAVQVILGAITVFTGNAPATVTLHFIGAILLLAAVTAAAVASFGPTGPVSTTSDSANRAGLLGWSALLALFALFVSGAIVVATGAGAACPSWPLCHRPRGVSAGLVAVQFTHRCVAAVTVILLLALAIRILARRPRIPGTVRLSRMLIVLLPAEVVAGAITALLRAPAGATDVHLALAAAIWASAVALVAVIQQSPGVPATSEPLVVTEMAGAGPT
ncbi:MAG: COX15/CtaA family protein, partial [Acidimicrobiales bacterium]